MSPLKETERSTVPTLLGFVALAVLAAFFVAAVLGSIRTTQWRSGLAKAEIAVEELARLEPIVARARLLEQGLPSAVDASASRTRTEVRSLLARLEATPLPPRPSRGRVPSRSELEAFESWLDTCYRRMAAGRDLENRLSALEQEARREPASAPGTGAATNE